MGDRCYVSLTCRKQDVPQFEALGFEIDEDANWDAEDDPAGVPMRGFEMNYAATSELEELAKAGIPFYGSHDSGGDYGPELFASAGGESTWVNHTGGNAPAVCVARDGSIDPYELDMAMTYYRLEAAATVLIDASTPTITEVP